MKRFVILAAISLCVGTTASAFQGGGGESPSRNPANKGSSRGQAPPGNRGPTISRSVPINLLRSIKIPAAVPLGNQVFSPDGTLLAASDRNDNVMLFDVQTGMPVRCLHTHTEQEISIAFSPNSTLIATGSYELNRSSGSGGEARLWNARTGNLLYVFKGSGALDVSFSPDGLSLAVGNNWGPNEVKLWDVRSGQLLWKFSGQGETGSRVVFSQDGKYMAVGYNKTIDIWEFHPMRLMRTIEHEFRGDEAVSFSRDSSLLVTIEAWTWLIRVWNVQTGALLGTIDAIYHFPGEGVDPGCYCSLVSISPDGQTLSALRDDGRIWKVWNIRTGKMVRAVRPATELEIYPGRILVDGKSYISWNNTNGIVQLWDISNIVLSANPDR